MYCPLRSEGPPGGPTSLSHGSSGNPPPATSSASVWLPELTAVVEQQKQHTLPVQQPITQHPLHSLSSQQQHQHHQSPVLPENQQQHEHQQQAASGHQTDPNVMPGVSHKALLNSGHAPAQEAAEVPASGGQQQRDAAAQTHMQMLQHQLHMAEREPVSGATDSGGYAHDRCTHLTQLEWFFWCWTEHCSAAWEQNTKGFRQNVQGFLRKLLIFMVAHVLYCGP